MDPIHTVRIIASVPGPELDQMRDIGHLRLSRGRSIRSKVTVHPAAADRWGKTRSFGERPRRQVRPSGFEVRQLMAPPCHSQGLARRCNARYLLVSVADPELGMQGGWPPVLRELLRWDRVLGVRLPRG